MPKRPAMSEPELLLYRSNLLGSDLRITNYGGGNTSAKVMAEGSADRRDGRGAVGQGLGRRPRLDEARRLRHALPWTSSKRLKKLYRGVEHEDEMVGYLPHCTFNLNPRAASIDTPLHAFVPDTHVDHMHPDAVIAIAAAKNCAGADAGDLRRRDRLAALEAAGLRARPQARRNSAARTRRRSASCWRATASSPGATRPRHCYETTHPHHQPRDRLARGRDRRQAGLRRRGRRSPAGGRARAPSPRG